MRRDPRPAIFGFPSLVIAFLIINFIALSASFAQACSSSFEIPTFKTRWQLCAAGQFVQDAYNPVSKRLCEEMEVDHLVSLYSAWSQGICGDELEGLANDPRNFRLTYWRTNRAKGSMSPEEFAATLPPEVAESVLRDAAEIGQDYKFNALQSLPAEVRLNEVSNELEQTRQELFASQNKVFSMRTRTVHYRGKEAKLADAIVDHTRRTRLRLIYAAQRTLAALPTESLPLIGTGISVGVTAWEIKDACDALKDNHELEIAFDDNAVFPEDALVICAQELPNKQEIVLMIKHAPAVTWNKTQATYYRLKSAIPSWKDWRQHFTRSTDKISEVSAGVINSASTLWEKTIHGV